MIMQSFSFSNLVICTKFHIFDKYYSYCISDKILHKLALSKNEKVIKCYHKYEPCVSPIVNSHKRQACAVMLVPSTLHFPQILNAPQYHIVKFDAVDSIVSDRFALFCT